MIDITGLREDKRPQSSTIVHALLDRLEAAEKAVTEAYQRGYAAGQEEIETERDALRAKIEQMEQQEPIGTAFLCVQCKTPFDGEHFCPKCGHHTATEENVYALPDAQAQPAPSVPDDVMRDTLRYRLLVNAAMLTKSLEAKP